MPTLYEATREVFPQLTEPQRLVLGALLYAPSHSSSAGQLRIILGFSAVIQVNAAMGQVGRKIFNLLRSHPDGLPDGEFEWWHVIATGEHVPNLGFVWSLRDEVVDALLACGMSSTGTTGPDEVSSQFKYVEGAVRSVVVNAYERNPVARARCIAAHGVVCAVCHFNFKSVYGEAADGYIHVHHLRPLATLAQEYEVDPVNDLRPVCPNCHAVIHLVNPPYTLEQVQAMLQPDNHSRMDSPASP